MIKETVEKAKDLVAKSKLGSDEKLELQKLLTDIRSELLHFDAQVTECTSRQNVYAEVSNKILDRIIDKIYTNY